MKVEITPDVANRLGYYVYLYVDPRDKQVFYVGKGAGNRATAHLDATEETQKVQRIREIREGGMEPRIEVISYNLPDEKTAFHVEAALIELLGITNLTNEVRGWGSVECQRKSLLDLAMECAPRKIEITEPSLLIRINRLFRYNMTDKELYEATRGVWVIGARRTKAKYAMAVYAGVVREVYIVDSWHPAGSTSYETRDAVSLRQDRRWEFAGHPADDGERAEYVGGSVEHYFLPGQQNPVVGVLL